MPKLTPSRPKCTTPAHYGDPRTASRVLRFRCADRSKALQDALCTLIDITVRSNLQKSGTCDINVSKQNILSSPHNRHAVRRIIDEQAPISTYHSPVGLTEVNDVVSGSNLSLFSADHPIHWTVCRACGRKGLD